MNMLWDNRMMFNERPRWITEPEQPVSDPETSGVRNLYEKEVTLNPEGVLAEVGKLELELVESEAAGTLTENAETLYARIQDALSKLDALPSLQNDDMQSVIDGQKTMLQKFSKVLEGVTHQ